MEQEIDDLCAHVDEAALACQDLVVDLSESVRKAELSNERSDGAVEVGDRRL